MKRARRSPTLTSLVDVLFILLFASLVQQRRAGHARAAEVAAAEAEAPDAGVPDAGAPDAGSGTEPRPDPHTAARAVRDRLHAERVVLVAVGGGGILRSVEVDGVRRELGVGLLRATGDARVVVYAAEDRPELRLCNVIVAALGAEVVNGALALVTTERPLRELPYALVQGLRSDTARCLQDAGAYALLIRAEDAVAP